MAGHKTPSNDDNDVKIINHSGANKRDEYHHLYDRQRWRNKRNGLRIIHLRNHPLCVMCDHDGFVIAATVVDHINPHKGDERLFFDPLNLQSLCKRHHDSDKAFMEINGYRKGCDDDGNPYDGWS